MLKKSVPIVLADGKTHNLRYDYNALCEIEDEIGISVDDVGKVIAEKPKLKHIRSILRAGLIYEEPGLTQKSVGKYIELDNVAAISQAILDALTIAFNLEGKKAEGPEPETPGTGSSS